MNILKKAYNYRVLLIGAAFWSISAASAYCGVFPAEDHLRKPMIFSEDGDRERAESALLYGSGIQRDPGLIRLLRSKIEREGKITFEEFMKTALYSENGYYYGGNAYITNGFGLKGDFFTLPERGFKTFGPAIAEQLVEMWKTMGEPSVFPVVEMGAGNGTLAKTVLAHLRKRHKEGLFR
ncbi:MAG: SAM-dependent methyltransferase, partial [Candidatus Omnitrophota bacterium]